MKLTAERQVNEGALRAHEQQLPISNLWDFVPASCHVVGYAPAFSGGNSMLDPTSQNRTILDEVNSQAGYPAGSLIPPTDRVLFADATINENLDGSGSWNDVVGGLLTAKILHRKHPLQFSDRL